MTNVLEELEVVPERRSLAALKRWRWWALVVAVLLTTVVYVQTRPLAQVSGSYVGYVGGQMSDHKMGLELRLTQIGSQVTGTCVIIDRGGRRRRSAELTGSVKGPWTTVAGDLSENSGHIVFTGRLTEDRSGLGGKWMLIGSYFVQTGGTRSDPVPFLAHTKKL